MHDQTYNGVANMAREATVAAALMQTYTAESGVNNHVLNVCIAMSCKVTQLFLCHDFLSPSSVERL